MIDALQVPADISGVGRQVLAIGEGLTGGGDPGQSGLGPPLVVRCAADTLEMFRVAFPADTQFETPLRSSHPRLRRLAYQQMWKPLIEPGSTVLVCPGDQAPLWGRSRVVLILHDVRRLSHPETSSLSERLLYRVLVPRSVRRAARVITPSQFSRSEILRLLAPRATVTVAASRATRGVIGGAPRADGHLIVVGAVRRYKGIDTLMKALAHIEPGDRPMTVVVGSLDGQDEVLGRRAEELGVSAHLRFEGWADDARLLELYAASSASVNPSTYEGYGLAVAESIALGLPTIASDIPPHREIAGDAAAYFPPGDDGALADVIRNVTADDAKRARLASASRARAQRLAVQEPSWAGALRDGVRDIRSE